MVLPMKKVLVEEEVVVILVEMVYTLLKKLTHFILEGIVSFSFIQR